LGLAKINEHNRKLALEGAKLISKIWQTEILIKNEEISVNMINILMPLQDEEKINKMFKYIYDKYNTMFLAFKFGGKFYCRVSAQIINEIEDYRIAAEALLDYIKHSST